MKTKPGKLALCLLTVFVCTLFAACKNPIIERWWGDDQNQRVLTPEEGGGNGGGGSGANFAVVVFDADGGIPGPRALNISWGGVIGRLRPMARGAYGFMGWFDENNRLWDVETRPVTKDDDVNGDGFITLQARWSPIFRTVSFVPDSVPSQLVAVGALVVQPVNPVAPRPDQGFARWEDEAGNPWNFAEREVRGYDIVLYARWAYNIRTVEFYANNGKRPDGTIMNRTSFTVPVGSHIQDPGPLTKDGNSFEGWFTDNIYFDERWNFAENLVEGPGTAPGVDPLNLYAKWVQNEYIVTFAVRSATATQPDMQQIPHGGRVAKPVFTNPGAVLLGWFTDWNLTNEWNFDTDTVTSSMTLFAKWEVTPETILRQVRIIRVSFIDFAGDSVKFNEEVSPIGGTDLTPQQVVNNIESINGVVEVLRQNTEFLLQLSGHANPTSQDFESELNDLKRISELRAGAVLNEIATQHGIARDRMINVGFNPMNLTNDPNHANLNRCVEMVIIEIIPD